MFMLRKAWPWHLVIMSLSVLISGSVVPLLLALAPASFLVARGCVDWTPVARAVHADAKAGCPRPPMMLM
jgi:hypothetical protein